LYPPVARRQVSYSPTIDAVLVRAETDDGTVGWGEAKAPVAAEATAEIIDALLSPIVVGTRLDEIAVTWERMYACMMNRGHHSGFLLEAIAGIDIALWDAWGRTLGQPISALLGGRFRDAVPVYASSIPAHGASGIEGVRAEAQAFVERGFRSIKVAIGHDPIGDVKAVAAVREIVGDDGGVFADASGRYDFSQAEWVGYRLAELNVGFFEMPLQAEDVQGYARLATKLRVPLALDTVATRRQYLQFLAAGALHVLQPDVNRAGGITETMRIAAVADAFGAQATPHVSIGSAVHFAASIQLALAIPNCMILEHWVGENPLGRPLAPDLDEPVGGLRQPADGSGLAITVDEEAVRRLASHR
jgi:D-arabinonate dehydratase/D-galactarolactone cycloisomerase